MTARTAAVQICDTPVRLSVQAAWKTPSASDARPKVWPPPSGNGSKTMVPRWRPIDFSSHDTDWHDRFGDGTARLRSQYRQRVAVRSFTIRL